jgi:hypothetical protein
MGRRFICFPPSRRNLLLHSNPLPVRTRQQCGARHTWTWCQPGSTWTWCQPGSGRRRQKGICEQEPAAKVRSAAALDLDWCWAAVSLPAQPRCQHLTPRKSGPRSQRGASSFRHRRWPHPTRPCLEPPTWPLLAPAVCFVSMSALQAATSGWKCYALTADLDWRRQLLLPAQLQYQHLFDINIEGSCVCPVVLCTFGLA